jgi:hypothetical protein
MNRYMVLGLEDGVLSHAEVICFAFIDGSKRLVGHGLLAAVRTDARARCELSRGIEVFH